MKFARRTVVQLVIAAVLASLLLGVGPGAPAARLGAAINYKYHLLLPNIANDGP